MHGGGFKSCEILLNASSRRFPVTARSPMLARRVAWLSVSKDGVQIARVYANRGVPQKDRTKYTVVTGSEATKTDCFGTTKIIWLLKHADGQLQEDNYESLLPRHLAYLQPLSERGDRVRCDMDLFATVKSLTGHERGDLVELYRQVVASDHKEAIDSWLSSHTSGDAGGKLENLVFLFDGLIRFGLMPDDLAHYRLVDWDEGTDSKDRWEW